MKKGKLTVLEIVKFYHPSKGGMESFVKLLVENLTSIHPFYFVNILTVNHKSAFRSAKVVSSRFNIFCNRAPVIFRSQPLKFYFPSLKGHLENADIIHHNFPFPNIEIWLLYYYRILRRKKFVITWHANIENTRWSLLNIFYKPIIKSLLKYADYIVVTSPALLENSSILKKFAHKIEIIPLCFNDSNFSNKPKRLNLSSVKKILFVGKLREYKGVQFLIESIIDLDVQLFVVGNGEYLNQLKIIVQKFGIEKKVHFILDANDELLKKLYQKSDLFVLPSINEAEAFGIVQLEALASGLPVLNTNLKSGVPFVSLDGVTGFTVEPKDSVAIKNSILKIFSDADQYETFSRNAIVRASEFSIPRMIESYNKLFLG